MEYDKIFKKTLEFKKEKVKQPLKKQPSLLFQSLT